MSFESTNSAPIDRTLDGSRQILNLGRPHTVRVSGKDRRFVVEEQCCPSSECPWFASTSSLRMLAPHTMLPWICLLVPRIRARCSVYLAMLDAAAQVALTLATLQKDNDPRWLQDWCTWHHRVHGVGGVTRYDSGNEYGPEVHAELSRRSPGLELVLVNGTFPTDQRNRFSCISRRPCGMEGRLVDLWCARARVGWRDGAKLGGF